MQNEINTKYKNKKALNEKPPLLGFLFSKIYYLLYIYIKSSNVSLNNKYYLIFVFKYYRKKKKIISYQL